MAKNRLYSLVTVFVILVLVLSACGAGSAASANKLEVFSWWVAGAEADALESMVQVFNAHHPDIEFINEAAGAGGNGRAVLVNRLQGGNPPDSWQGHAGQELIGVYVADEQIEPLNDLYKLESWLDVLPKRLLPFISQDGNLYSVPVSIHRTNVLWHNPSVLANSSVAVPTTLDEWFTTMDKLQEEGVTPLALGDQRTRMVLLETILLASLGRDQYNNLWDGTIDWTGADVTFALQNYQKALTYANSDSESLSWQDAAKLVVDGDAAFFVMGDWVEGYYRELGNTPLTDYGWSPVPGTTDNFQFMSDSFVLAVGAPHRESAIEWLKTAGSKEGQEAFNPVNGSICARTDCDQSLFGEYQQSAMDDWSGNSLVGSLTYGVVASDAWKLEINKALNAFIEEGDLEAFQNALVTACESSGPCSK
jgi:glucose/mannose transport system substrate-binding protein